MVLSSISFSMKCMTRTQLYHLYTPLLVLAEDISVPFDEYRWLTTPDAYPSRDINTTKDYLLYRASSPPNSHLLIEVIKVVFDGDDSTLTIGTGHDPVQVNANTSLVLILCLNAYLPHLHFCIEQ